METKKKALLALAFVMTLGQSVPVNAQQVNRVTPPSTGWRKFGDPQQTEAPPPEYNDPQPQDAQQPPPGQYPQQRQFGQSVTLPAGTWITIRVNQPLSSEYNQPGD